jgi:hypothetical protein
MLELRPNCELCDVDLPPDALNVRICSYECTYCAACADDRAQERLPDLRRRPRAPADPAPRQAYHHPHISLGLGFHAAGDSRKHSRWSRDEIAAMTARLKDVPPEKR